MTVFVRGEFRAREGRIEDFRAVALALQTAALEEPGTLRYAWFGSDEPDRFVVLEEYVDDAAAFAHNERCAELLRRSATVGDMIGVHLHGDLGAGLLAWVDDHPQAVAHHPIVAA